MSLQNGTVAAQHHEATEEDLVALWDKVTQEIAHIEAGA